MNLVPVIDDSVTRPIGDRVRLASRRVGAAGAIAVVAAISVSVPAHADQVAYLVNVTVRPGYNFPNAEAALAYGHGLCDKISHNVAYSQLIDDVKHDFGTEDGYQGAYLVSQAAQELCPQLIWQLRRSAAGYRG
jgi:hypothetical protein